MPSRYSNEEEIRFALIGALVNEFVDRRARGETVSETELLSAHPDLADDLREMLESLDGIGALPNRRLNQLLRLGILTRTNDTRYQAELGPWRILRELGAGGMGVVLLADEPALDRRVAIKFLKPELADDPGCRLRFTHEAKAAAILKHPNIIEIHTLGESAAVPYIVMEYVEGPSLAEVIRETYRPSALSYQSSSISHRLDETTVAKPRVGCNPVAADPRVGRDPVAPNPRVNRSQPEPERQRAEHSEVEARTSASGEHEAPASDSFNHRVHQREVVRLHLTTVTIREIFRQLLEALAAAHEKGLIHRDVKPSNILLELSGNQLLEPRVESCAAALNPEPRTLNPESFFRVKLADFGLARSLSAQTRVTVADKLLGTPEYMSPEQARGDADVDHRTDLYSAGVVLYEMLTGRPPFRAETPSGVIHKIFTVPPPDPREINREADVTLAAVAMRLMKKDRQDRLRSATEALGLSRSNPGMYFSWRRRRRFFRASLSVLIGFILLTVVWWIIQVTPTTYTAATENITASLPVITDVRIEHVTPGRTAVQIQIGGVWREIAQEVRDPVAVGLVDVNGNGEQIIVVGCKAIGESRTFIVYDSSGKRLWDLDPSDYQQWPNAGPPKYWHCALIAACDLDGKPGDEIVMVAKDPQDYACRVSIVDPRKRAFSKTIWHPGGLAGLKIEENFFAERPAIIVWGINNKIDGHEDPVPARYLGLRYTKYPQVPIVMIIDPDRMDGLAPPPTELVPWLNPATPYAYGFLDLPNGNGAYFDDDANPLTTITEEGFEIGAVQRAPDAEQPEGTQPWLELNLTRPPNATNREAGTYILDRSLTFQRFIPSGDCPIEHRDPEHWKSLWHPIIQNYQYIEK